MQLHSLEMFGFKSFANRTRFDFGSGVTVIVGPNGCGKSNVVDSLKWALGEQSAKSLRGSEMLDVVFNGSQARKPLNFAEVSLTFRNCKGVLHPDLDEMKVTRKLFRSGESEYQINREPCRLKDIRELFMDTGVGMKAYSIIEQGRIDALLQASSLDRRAIFDEAAGISKYKVRKKEAERRLERALQNLEVIDATLEEVGKRLRSLKIQAGRARKYIEYRDELRKRKIAQALHRFHGLRQERARVSGDLVMAEDEKAGLDAGFAKAEADLTDIQLRLHEHEERHRQAAGEAERIDTQIRAWTQRREDLNRNLRDIESEEAQLEVRRASCVEQVERLRKALASADEAEKKVRGEVEQLAARIREASALLDGLRAELAGLDAKIAGWKAEALDNEAARSGERSGIGAIEEDLAALGRERAGFEATHAKVESQHQQALEARAKAERELADVSEVLAGLKSTHLEVQKTLAELTERQKGLDARAKGLGERKIALESRLDVLKKYQERLEGVGDGASRVVLGAAREGGGLQGVAGLLSDRLRVPARYVEAVEAALGRFEEAVLVEDLEAALGAVEYLRDGEKGRASAVPRSGPAPEAPPDRSTWAYPGVLGRAADLVESAPEDRAWIERVLGRVLVVEGLDVALGLAGVLGSAWSFATLDGERLDPGAVLTGGVSVKGRIARAAEIEELARDIERTAREIEENRREREELGRVAGSVEERAKNLRNEISDRSHDELGFRKDLDAASGSSEQLGREKGVLEGEIARVGEEQEARGRELAEAKARLEALERRAAAIREDTAAAESGRKAADERRIEEEKKFNDLRVEEGRVGERAKGLRESVERIGQDIRAEEEEYRDTVLRIEGSAAKKASLRAELATIEQDAASAAGRLEEVRREAGYLSDTCDGLRQEAAQREADAKQIRGKLDDVAVRVNDLKIKENGFAIKIDELVARSGEEFSVVLTDLYEGFKDDGGDWDEVARQIEDLKDKIDKLGNVNLEAIRECEEEEARNEYLSTQKEDLVSAREQILNVIKKIDKLCRDLFLKTFADVRESFKVLFRKLFGGGKADVMLEDESNVLDSGVEVIAQPKDKKPSSITLLSGGEKVMTCIALLFAIFRAKPSPFCILDEVDAALDEGNVDRFVGMLREFVTGSQFIIITHNKKTMMVGDTLFGVTMQEPGVSKKVSLKVEEAREVVDGAPRKDWKTLQDFAVKEPDAAGEETPAAPPAAASPGAATAEPEPAGESKPEAAEVDAEAAAPVTAPEPHADAAGPAAPEPAAATRTQARGESPAPASPEPPAAPAAVESRETPAEPAPAESGDETVAAHAPSQGEDAAGK